MPCWAAAAAQPKPWAHSVHPTGTEAAPRARGCTTGTTEDTGTAGLPGGTDLEAAQEAGQHRAQ